MTDTSLHCPSCGHRFALTEALTAQIRGRLESDLAQEQQRRLAQAIEHARGEASEPLRRQLEALRLEARTHERQAQEAEQRELALRGRTLQLESEQRDAEQRLRIEIEGQLRPAADARARTLAEAAANNVRAAAALEMAQAQQQLEAQRAQLDQARQNELALRRQSEELQTRERNVELELARQLDAKRAEWEGQWRDAQGEQQSLKLREKERQIDDLRRALDDLKRKSEQGSHERQGETLELDIEAALTARFPRDLLRPVPKGAQGADLLHEVRNASLMPCGSIVWEFKHTRAWQPAWLAKLRDDQRSCGASIAVLVSVALPEAARAGFALIDGVWVCGIAAWPALATALREQLLQVAFARAAATGMADKMEALYGYLSGDAFRHKVEAIVEAFTAMHGQIARERRAMEKQWKERECQLDRIIGSTAGMYGELRGTIGSAMRPIAALELDADDAGESCSVASLPAPAA